MSNFAALAITLTPIVVFLIFISSSLSKIAESLDNICKELRWTREQALANQLGKELR